MTRNRTLILFVFSLLIILSSTISLGIMFYIINMTPLLDLSDYLGKHSYQQTLIMHFTKNTSRNFNAARESPQPHSQPHLRVHYTCNNLIRITLVIHQTYGNWLIPKPYETNITSIIEKHCIQFHNNLPDFEHQTIFSQC